MFCQHYPVIKVYYFELICLDSCLHEVTRHSDGLRLNVKYGLERQFKLNQSISMTRKALPLLAVATLLLLLISCSKQAEEQSGGFPPPAVSIAEVVVRNITPWEEFSGRIEAKESVQIRPRVGAVIEEIRYIEGEIVKKGDLLFVLDKQPFLAELNRAEAELGRARTQAELAKVESRRAKNLVSRKLLSDGEYDQRVAAEDQANANVLSAEATVQLARLNLEYTKVRSPIHGRSGRALVTKGNLVMSDPTPDLLTTILSVDPVYVVFDIDELSFLRFFANSRQQGEQDVIEKRPVFVGVGSEEGFPRKAYVDFIDNQLAVDTGTIRLRAVLDNKDYLLTPGLFARVKLLATDSQQMILISDQAVLTDQDRKYVYVVGEDNLAKRRNIQSGQAVEGLRIVIDGLAPGEHVIVHGVQKVFFPNMPVMPQVIGMGDPPPSAGPAAAH